MIQLQTMPSEAQLTHRLSTMPSHRGLPPSEQCRGGAGEYRKKIENFSFLLSDSIGKGYSSTVYKGLNDLTGTFPSTQANKWP
jgi:hypothetical protein